MDTLDAFSSTPKEIFGSFLMIYICDCSVVSRCANEVGGKHEFSDAGLGNREAL